MNKLIMTVGSVALMALAGPVFAQSAAPDASAPASPAVTAPNNSSVNAPQDTAPMSSKDSTSAVAPAMGATQSSDSMNSDSQKSMHVSHKMHHAKAMSTTKASGNKSTDHDAELLNQQELGKLQQSN